MKRIILILGILLISGSAPASADVASLFGQANACYEKGNCADAIRSYEEIIENGVRDPAVYYNLGNAYYKNNQLGRAVLAYKRALRLSSRDADIKNNLEYVLSFIKEERPKSPIEKLLDRLFNIVSLNALTLFVHYTYILLFIILAVYLFVKRKPLFWINVSLGIMLLLSGAWLYGRIYSREIIKKAVVIVTQGQVRNGPGEDYSVAFTVPEGKELVIIERRNPWYEIGVKEKGIRGWIRREEIEQI